MSVTINYNKRPLKKNLSSPILFCDEKFNISSLKKHVIASEYSFITDLIKSKDTKKNILSFDINSKKKLF